jgi:ATP-dependent RNA helicase DeaD
VNTRAQASELAAQLAADGFAAAPISGELEQNQRTRTLEAFRSGVTTTLVATDVAARGLDVERISHVVNFDIPTDTESYVHRIGRTGRAGRSGDAISFVTPRERGLVRAIERATRQELTEMRLPSVDEVNVTRLSRFDDRITAALAETERIDGFRDIVAHYVRNHDVPEVDVAAALAVVAQGESPLLLEPEPERPVREHRDRDDRDRGRDDRGTRPERRPREGMATYRIAVGKRHRVEPRQIVGALANEGGLRRDDFGAIQIRPDFSLVELPADLPRGTMERLSDTRISGRLIELRPDTGGPGRRRESDRGPREERPARDARRPRHSRSDG